MSRLVQMMSIALIALIAATACVPADARPSITGDTGLGRPIPSEGSEPSAEGYGSTGGTVPPADAPGGLAANDPNAAAFLGRLDTTGTVTFTATYSVRRPALAENHEVLVAQRNGDVAVTSGGRTVFGGVRRAVCDLTVQTCIEDVIDGDLAGVGWDFFAAGAAKRITAALQRTQAPSTIQEQSMAGVDVTCIVLRQRDEDSSLFCRTDEGVLAFADDGDVQIEMLGFVRRVDADAFSP